MPIEVANFVQDLDVSNPPGSDDRSQGDNHLRLIKTALKATFPNASKAFQFPTSGATKTANFSVTFPTDQNVAFAIDSTAGAVGVTLPDPTSGGTVNEDGFGFWLIRTAGANAVTVTPSGAQTIMGAATYSMPAIRQYAYLFWAGTQDRWLVFEGNNPAFTFGLQIVTSAETALIVRRTENVLNTEYTLASWRLGSGAGAVAADTYVSGGANDVIERRRYIGATEIERLTTTLALYNILFGIGASLRLSPSGFVDLSEIAAPAAPAANTSRLYSKDDGSGTTLVFAQDSAGVEVPIVTPATRAMLEAFVNIVNPVTPGRQHFHPAMPKATGRGDADGLIVGTAYNVASIAKSATGIYLVTLTNAMADTDYWVFATALVPGSNDRFANVEIVSESTFRVRTYNSAAGLSDLGFCFAVYGTLA